MKTSWPYFGVKLSCVCLKFVLKKKNINFKVTYSYPTYSYPEVTYSGPRQRFKG